MKPLTILGIESSCDETSAAVLRDRVVLSNIIAGQQVHELYGGVVPELASRAHQSNIIPVVSEALRTANVNMDEIDAIAYTIGPGLIGALMVGSAFAKGLSVATGIPLIEVDHMKAHVLAHFIIDSQQQNPEPPFLCLTVSGGHTQIVLVKSAYAQEIIGKTLDDAAGEAFDKSAKIIGLPYPGGPLIDRLSKSGDPFKFQFSKPEIPGLNFSFSGLKTSILYFVRDELRKNPNFLLDEQANLAASIQQSIVSALIVKVRRAIDVTGIRKVAVAGGVSANSGLRQALLDLQRNGCEVFLPKFEFCTDNAAMIAVTGHYDFLMNKFGKLDASPKARI